MFNLDNINSSYAKNNLYRELYTYVLGRNPKKVIEFGCLEGYSTVAIAKALMNLNNGGTLKAYDLWHEYPYKAGIKNEVRFNLAKNNISSIVELGTMDFYKFLDNPEPFDLLHLDISNDGDIIEKAIDALWPQLKTGSTIIFEGGSEERDNEKWMLDYNKKPITSIKHNYTLLTDKWPSIGLYNYE